MKIWGIPAIIVVVVALMGVAFLSAGALPNSVDQAGDGPIIAYIHPSAVFGVCNIDVIGEAYWLSIQKINATVDKVSPGWNLFALHPITGNVSIVFTLEGVGSITEDCPYAVPSLTYQKFTADTDKAFGMKIPGTYILQVEIYDLPSNVLKDTEQISVVVV